MITENELSELTDEELVRRITVAQASLLAAGPRANPLPWVYSLSAYNAELALRNWRARSGDPR